MQLIFVYNADSGVFNTLTDIAHKLLSPKTYQCNLCSLTHGYFQERDEWTTFLKDLDAELTFLHRDEYIKQYAQHDGDFPAIFIKEDSGLKLWMDSAVINNVKSTDELMAMIRALILQHQSAESVA